MYQGRQLHHSPKSNAIPTIRQVHSIRHPASLPEITCDPNSTDATSIPIPCITPQNYMRSQRKASSRKSRAPASLPKTTFAPNYSQPDSTHLSPCITPKNYMRSQRGTNANQAVQPCITPQNQMRSQLEFRRWSTLHHSPKLHAIPTACAQRRVIDRLHHSPELHAIPTADVCVALGLALHHSQNYMRSQRPLVSAGRVSACITPKN